MKTVKIALILSSVIYLNADSNITQESLILKEKELELRARELKLKEKELELQEKGNIINNGYIAPSSYKKTVSKFNNLAESKGYQKRSSKDRYIKYTYETGSATTGINGGSRYNSLKFEKLDTSANSIIFGFGKSYTNRQEISITKYLIDKIDFDSIGYGWRYLWVWDNKYISPYIGFGLELLTSDKVQDKFDSDIGFGVNLSFGLLFEIKRDFELGIGININSHNYTIDSYCTDYKNYSCNEYDTIDWIETRTLTQFSIAYRF